MKNRLTIKSLISAEDGPVSIGGWVETVRDQKKVQFVVVRDETAAVQLVNVRHGADDERANLISALTLGSFVEVTGDLVHNEKVKLNGMEIQLDTIAVVGAALPDNPISSDSSIEKRLDWRFLDLRRPEQALIFRIQTTFEQGLRSYWIDKGFFEIHTPKLMASPSESRAELFQVPYFDTTAYLAQSPQHFKQMAQSAGFGGVFEIAPAFRADPSFTSRHATEFTSIDMEVSWIDSHEDIARLHEEALVAAFTAVVDKHGEDIEKLYGQTLTVPTLPFPRIPLAEVREILAAGGYVIPRADGDLDPEGERRISAYVQEKYGHDFVFVTDYDVAIRPFYHMRHTDDPTLTNSYDLIYRGTEISTGAQREHRPDVLAQQAQEKGLDVAELETYINFFRYGVPPHGGYGMGLARVLMLMLGLPSIRETTYLFRGPNHLRP